MSGASSSSQRRWYHPLELLKRVLVYALIIYIVICFYLFCMQKKLTYPLISEAPMPQEMAVRLAKSVHLMPWDHPTPGALLPQGFVPTDFTAPAPRGTIVVFHGNGEWGGGLDNYVAAFRKRGFRTFLYEYPGYGSRSGQPSESVIVPDARALIRSLDQAGYGPIYVWGESLGSGIASAVCGDYSLPIHGLTLVTPWDNIANVGLSMYPYIPVRQLMLDKYDSIANLAHFPHPICIVRCTNDTVILPRLTLNLIAHLPDPHKVIVHQGVDHNEWPRTPDLAWWDEALDFIAPKHP